MYALLFLFLLLCLLSGRPRLSAEPLRSGTYMAPERTRMINGIFMGLMLIRHTIIFGHEPSVFWDIQYYRHIDIPMVQFIVCTFFFYSGYGIMHGLYTKGKTYLRSLLTKRFPTLYIRLAIGAGLAYLFCGLTYMNMDEALLKWGLTLIGMGGYWFIIASLVLYLLTAFAFALCGLRHPLRAVCFLTFCISLLVVLLAPHKSSWWLDTEFSFSGGMVFYLYRERLDALLKRSPALMPVLGFLLVAFAVFTVQRYFAVCHLGERLCRIPLECDALHYHYISLLSICFALGVTWVCAIVEWEKCNPLLVWMGKAAFFLFVFQYFPIRTFKYYGLEAYSPALYILCSMLAALLLSAAMQYLFGKGEAALLHGWQRLRGNSTM